VKAFGWTVRQWGLALSLFGMRPTSIRGFLECRRRWVVRFFHDPYEELSIYSPEGDTRPCDLESAYRLFDLVSERQLELSSRS